MSSRIRLFASSLVTSATISSTAWSTDITTFTSGGTATTTVVLSLGQSFTGLSTTDDLTLDAGLVPAITSTSLADLDGDGAVDFNDLVLLLSEWGACADCTADIDGDGSVGLTDLLQILAAWT